MREVRDRPVYAGWRLTKEDQESKNKTKILYNGFRRMKDEKREETYEKNLAEEREALKRQAAASKGLSLQGISQFDKQANEVEFMDYVSRPTKKAAAAAPEDAEKKLTDLKKGKQNDLSQSLVQVKEESQKSLESDANQPKFLVRANDVFKLYWDSVILLIAIFNSFSIPLALAFSGIGRDLAEDPFYVLTNIVGTILFMLDILLNMNTTYYDLDGEEIVERKKIVKHYLGGMFLIDFISSLPLESIDGIPEQVRLLNMLKIIRVLRITDVINKSNFGEEMKSRFRMAQIVFFLVLTIHIISCVWHYLCRADEVWIPCLDFAWAGLYPKVYRFYSKDDWYKYFVCLYNGILFLGGNEMGPRTEVEIVACTLMLVSLAVFNAWLFGDMAVQTEMSGRKQAEFQEQIDVANTAMEHMDLPPFFQEKVRAFLVFTIGTKSQQGQLKGFINMISPSLQEQVSIKIFSAVIKDNPTFLNVFLEKQSVERELLGYEVDLKEIAHTMISKFTTVLLQPEDLVVQQLDHDGDSSMYLIADGACQVKI